MEQDVRLRFDAAAAQVQEFRDYAAQRFDQVIGEIRRIGSYDAPCELIFDRGVAEFIKSLIWCIFVFLRMVVLLIAYIRQVYFEFKARFFRLFPDNIMGVPIHWLLDALFGIMEWGAILTVIDQYIGKLLNMPNMGTDFIIFTGGFIINVFNHVFELVKYIWDGLTEPIKKAIVKLGEEFGVWKWFENLWTNIYEFFTNTIAQAISKAQTIVTDAATSAAEAAYEKITTVPDVGLYDLLGWKKELGGGGRNEKLLAWVKNAEKYGYLNIISISSLLNILSIINISKYIVDLQKNKKVRIDNTFIEYLKSPKKNILAFEKRVNKLYKVLIKSGMKFENNKSVIGRILDLPKNISKRLSIRSKKSSKKSDKSPDSNSKRKTQRGRKNSTRRRSILAF
jgi:hypothetical protein